MLKRARERIHTVPEGRRCVIAFLFGAVLFMVFYTALREIDRIPGLYLDLSTHGLVINYPVILCFITCLMDEDLMPTVAACLGASAVIVVPFCFDGYVSDAVKIAAVFALHGVCFYYGRKTGWKAAILRTLSLSPTFVFSICFFVFEFRGGKTIINNIYMFLMLILSIVCYYMIGRKNAWTTKDIIRAFIVIIPAAFILLFPVMYLYLIFIPYYNP